MGVHLGRQALLSGAADLAICVGVNTCMGVEGFANLSSAGMLSPQVTSQRKPNHKNQKIKKQKKGRRLKFSYIEVLRDRIDVNQ